MARGWESKSVESQIEAAGTSRRSQSRKGSATEGAEVQRKKETLRLAKTRLLGQLQGCENPRYREMIEQALAELEKNLARYH